MKTQFKVLSILAAALAVVFSTVSVSMAFSTPGEMANCRAIDSGLSFECDPVSNLAVVNSGVIPVTGLALPSVATSLRGVNDLTPSATELILADFVANPSATELILADFVANPSATELILADFVANPSMVATSLRSINDIVFAMPATSLRAINEIDLGAADLNLNDAALDLQAKESKLMPDPAAFYYGAR